MTSSLVGSEMCIRDSCGNGRAPPSPAADSLLAMWKAHMTYVLVQHTSCAVSYTHLTLPTICSV
eukprot:10185036-Prorocentrum_lima.AAC.1